MAIPTPRITRSRRASIAITVAPDGTIEVKAPRFAPQSLINAFLREKQDWIEKTLSQIEKRKPAKKTYQNGEAFYFLGEKKTFTIYNGIEIKIKDSQLLFPQVMLLRAQKEIISWYKKQAGTIITQRLFTKSSEMKASYKSFFISDTKSKWGTCFPDNSLQFNWRLVMAPIMVLDYVIIHELTHTTEKNHGDNFWRRVRNFTPAYRQHRKWLEENAHLLII
ncbi:MAG TPA: SprT family zinc-dependent metalloprotease [Candidatus Saccharimonadales bacterium]|nr:SprT family zinc-dependent metalloprotease [Candidatus Saccharimonadales bacterium]